MATITQWEINWLDDNDEQWMDEGIYISIPISKYFVTKPKNYFFTTKPKTYYFVTKPKTYYFITKNK